MAQAASTTCEICVAGPGEHYCSQCQQLFCDGCKTSHLRAKISKNHTFLTGPNINPEEKLYCDEHSESLRFECVQCSAVVCAICSIKKHNRHDIVEIKDSVASLRSELFHAISTKLDTLQSDVDKIKDGTKTYKHDVDAVIKTIKADGNTIKNMVDRKVENLIKNLREKEAKESAILNKLEKDLSDMLETGRKYQHRFDEVQKTVGEVAVLKKLKNLKAEVDRIQSKQIPQFPSVKYTQKNVIDSEINKLFGTLSLL